jgi:hypothetical protein
MARVFSLGNEKGRLKATKTITKLETKGERPKERWLAVKLKTSFYRGTKESLDETLLGQETSSNSRNFENNDNLENKSEYMMFSTNLMFDTCCFEVSGIQS